MKNDPTAAGSFLVPSSLELSYLSVNVGVKVRDSPNVSHDATKEAVLNVSESRACKNHQCQFEKQESGGVRGGVKVGDTVGRCRGNCPATHTQRTKAFKRNPQEWGPGVWGEGGGWREGGAHRNVESAL